MNALCHTQKEEILQKKESQRGISRREKLREPQVLAFPDYQAGCFPFLFISPLGTRNTVLEEKIVSVFENAMRSTFDFLSDCRFLSAFTYPEVTTKFHHTPFSANLKISSFKTRSCTFSLIQLFSKNVLFEKN